MWLMSAKPFYVVYPDETAGTWRDSSCSGFPGQFREQESPTGSLERTQGREAFRGIRN
jgi:hypothetical protein